MKLLTRDEQRGATRVARAVGHDIQDNARAEVSEARRNLALAAWLGIITREDALDVAFPPSKYERSK